MSRSRTWTWTTLESPRRVPLLTSSKQTLQGSSTRSPYDQTMSSSRLYLKNLPSDASRKDTSTTIRSSDSRPTRSPRYGVQPKYYPKRAHQCRFPVLVEHIPGHICWQELKDFGRLAGGLVAYCDLDRNKNGRGFIEYLSQEDAEDAIRLLNGQSLGGHTVSVSVQSTARRRSSRSHSPTRRSHSSMRPASYRVPDVPLQTIDEPRGRCVFPTSASRYSSLPKSPERSSSSHQFRSSPYSDEPALRVSIHPCSDTFSSTVDSYRRSELCDGTIAQGTALMRQPSSYIGTVLSDDYYNFDQYLRLSYERRLECPYS
ncbi:hypothetical protein DFH07DRAFT_26922 [Mycena maculata]|uniref:RRM domain-containing protein n=1 Tax=Mycena maculata TaxID=230809 RepID=A0AAD7IKY9_9AGAR|nr:hypothetical protein DFH07DRAFT_26922 [Mycena maculata]